MEYNKRRGRPKKKKILIDKNVSDSDSLKNNEEEIPFVEEEEVIWKSFDDFISPRKARILFFFFKTVFFSIATIFIILSLYDGVGIVKYNYEKIEYSNLYDTKFRYISVITSFCILIISMIIIHFDNIIEYCKMIDENFWKLSTYEKTFVVIFTLNCIFMYVYSTYYYEINNTYYFHLKTFPILYSFIIFRFIWDKLVEVNNKYPQLFSFKKTIIKKKYLN